MGKLSSATEKANISAAYPYRRINFIPALGIISELPTTVRDGAVTFKGSHRMGDGPIFLKISAPHSLVFNDDFSNEPTFSQIHLARQYL
jgi:hypothetical protein